MKNLILQFIARTLIALTLTTASCAEPTNLHVLKNEIRAYHDSGLYEKELTQAIGKAQDYILHQAELNAQTHQPKKLALILDIDETSLSNYDKMVKRDFHFDREQVHQEILAADLNVISPMLTLYNKARAHGIDVFFVTGRPQTELDATKANLLKAGYKNWSGLYLRPEGYNQASIIPFKSQTRKLIEEKGYTVVASIGDQYSDIMGGYTQRGFKLPNPYYYLP